MRPGDASAIVGRVIAGDRSAGRELLAALAVADPETAARFLDPLARAAATSGRALEVLLTAVDRQDLAGPAVHALLVNPHDAEEVTQDVLIAVCRSIGSYRGEARFTTWLATVARNTAIAYLRAKRDAVELDDDAPLSIGPRLSSMIATRATLRAAIEQLEPLYREPLVLRDVEHRSYQAVADELGLPLNTVKSRVLRARALLVGALGPGLLPDG